MEIHELDNGIRLYVNPLGDVSTVGIAVTVNVGSLYEDKRFRGISHLLEHMMFKSNKKYSAKQINEGLELYGGVANAFTGTFLTSYIIEVLPEGFTKVLDIIYSMFENKEYLDKEFELEKKVVLSEIERYENDPESRLERLIPKSIFGESDYGDPIGGYRETVKNIDKEYLEEFKLKYYSPKNMYIILTGNINEKMIELVKNYFERLEGERVKLKAPEKGKGNNIKIEMNTQNQIYYSLNFEINSDLHTVEAFSKFISGGLSSLTFQIIREKRGIGYLVYFEPTYHYPDGTVLSLVVPGFEKDKVSDLKEGISELLDTVTKENLREYYEGRIRRTKLLYEKERKNLYLRLFIEPYTIYYYNESYDEFYRKVLSIDLESIKEFVESLENGREVWIYPNP